MKTIVSLAILALAVTGSRSVFAEDADPPPDLSTSVCKRIG